MKKTGNQKLQTKQDYDGQMLQRDIKAMAFALVSQQNYISLDNFPAS